MSTVYYDWLGKAYVDPYFGTVQYFYKVIFRNDDLESTGLENVWFTLHEVITF